MKKQYATWLNYLQRFVYLQLFLTLISLPILIHWGLAVSWLSCIGNLIFSPVLTVFLLLSSLIFFCNLLGIPCAALCWSLERVTKSWLFVMHRCAGKWYVGFPTQSWPVLLLLIILVIAIVHARSIQKAWQGILCLSILAILFWIAGYALSDACTTKVIETARGSLEIIKNRGKVVCIDHGCLARQLSLSSWLQYTLAPALMTMTGSVRIDHLVLKSNSMRVLDGLQKNMGRLSIKNIYLPSWRGKLRDRHYWAYKKFRAVAEESKCAVIVIYERPLEIEAGIMLEPTGYLKKGEYEMATFEIARSP